MLDRRLSVDVTVHPAAFLSPSTVIFTYFLEHPALSAILLPFLHQGVDWIPENIRLCPWDPLVVRLLAPRAGVLEMRVSFQGVNAYIVRYFAFYIPNSFDSCHESWTVYGLLFVCGCFFPLQNNNFLDFPVYAGKRTLDNSDNLMTRSHVTSHPSSSWCDGRRLHAIS